MPSGAPLGPAPAALPTDWPHRSFSHSLQAGGLLWHLQVMRPPLADEAPVVLLLHGTGASSHSFFKLASVLAQSHTLLMPDLPGHGWTQRPAGDGLSLPGMARSLGALLATLGARPVLLIGHSAGAAIAARLCLDGHCAPHGLLSLNGAWFPPRGVSQGWFAPAAKLLVRNPLLPHFFAWQASRPAVLKRLLDSTGSKLDAAAAAPYARLVSSPAHVSAVLAMMAAWDLRPLLHDLPQLRPRLHLVVGQSDGTIAPHQAHQVQQMVPGSRVHSLPGLGHLAHEEAPAAVAQLVMQLLTGLAAPGRAVPD